MASLACMVCITRDRGKITSNDQTKTAEKALYSVKSVSQLTAKANS